MRGAPMRLALWTVAESQTERRNETPALPGEQHRRSWVLARMKLTGDCLVYESDGDKGRRQNVGFHA